MAWGQVTTLVESAENGLATVSIQSSPGYNPFSPNIFADSSPHSFHLAQPDWADQWVRLKTAVTPQAGSVLKFKSRLAWSGSGQTTHVQVSGNGGATWSDVFTQTGSDSAGEQAFSDRTVSLDGFAGQSIQIRFLYVADVNGSTFTASGDSGQFIAGWFIDMIQVFNAGSSVPVLSEGAESGLAGVTIQSSPGYNVFSTKIYADGAMHSFHLAQPDWADQWVRLKTAVIPQAGSVLRFKSRLAWSGSGQTTHVQVSGDGGATWGDVLTQTGTDSAGEQAFSDRTVSLDGFAGQTIQVRFLYVADVNGSTFTASGDSGQFIAGWFIDLITITNVLLSNPTAPVITQQPQSKMAAEGGAVTFTVSASGSGPLNYQ